MTTTTTAPATDDEAEFRRRKRYMAGIVWVILTAAIFWTLVTVTFGEGEKGDRNWIYGMDLFLSFLALAAVTVFAAYRLINDPRDAGKAGARPQLLSSPTGLLLATAIMYGAAAVLQSANYFEPTYEFYSMSKVVMMVGLMLRG
jgi:cell division protein FtsW (lipid II flippase)